jgi:beta-lactamase regulating signal transducer with metallopeptidase domain
METLIGLALKSLLIAGATLALLHFTRRRSASERSLIAHLGLIALVALPIASLFLPAVHIAVPDAFQPAPIAAERAAPAQADAAGSLTVTKGSGGKMVIAAPAADEPTASAMVVPRVDWTPVAYALPAIALLLLTLVALLRLVALRSRAQVLVDPTWLTALAHAQRRMGFKNGTALLTSNELSSPISWGLMRPVILLNDEALKASGEAEAIIAHELAHVARLDWAKLMIARVATAIFWFNPLAWVLAREAHQLREEAADDAVLASNIADTDYAQLLVGVARHECNGLLIGAHGVAPSKGSLRRRVGRVLDGSLARGPAARSWVAGFAAGMLVMAAPLAALTFAPKDKLPADSLIGKDNIEGKSWALAANPSTAPLPAAISTTVANAVSASVAAAAGTGPSAAWAHEFARDAAIEAGKARDDAKSAKTKASKDKLVDLAMAWKAVGVTPGYAASVRAAAPYLRIDNEDLVGMKAVGLTPAYIADMSRAGYRASDVDDLVGAYAVGVDATYIRDLASAGYRNIPLDDLTGMRALGVTGAYIRSLSAAGITGLTPDKLTELRAHGIDPGNVRRLRVSRPPPTPADPPEPPGQDEDPDPSEN